MSSSFEFGDWIFLLTSIFEMLMFCGFQTGWSSLVYVLVEEGIYSHLCAPEDVPNIEERWNASSSQMHLAPNLTNNCLAQQEMLNLAYTLATSVSSFAAFPIGIAMDCVGPRLTRITSGFFLGFSCLLLSYLNKQNPGLLFVGLIVACISNLVMFMTPQTCMLRFKKGRSMLIGLYCATWVASSLTFLGFKVLYEHGGVSVAHFFRFLSVGCVFFCINAALLYPDSNVQPREEKQQGKTQTFKPKHAIEHTRFSYIRKELQKCKLCLGHMMNNEKDSTMNSVKSDRVSNEWKQLIPKIVVENSLGETHSNSNRQMVLKNTKICTNGVQLYQLARTKTLIDLSQRQNLSSNFFADCCDVKRVTYAECPTLGPCCDTKDNVQLLDNSEQIKDNETPRSDLEPSQKTSQKNPKVHQKPCQNREEQLEAKDPLDNRSTDLQVWTANSAVAYLKSGISFKHCVISSLHILAQVFLTVCKVRTWFFVGTFSNFISDLSGGDRSTVAQFVNIFGISHVGALIMGPLFGYIIDRQCARDGMDELVKPSKDTEKQHQKFMMDIEATPKAMDFIIQCNRKTIFKLNDAVLVTSSATVIFCLMALIPSLTLQIATFQLFVFVKVAYDTAFASILITIFPQNHLGKLMGLAALIGAIFSLFQYPLFVVMEVWFEGRILEVNIFLWLTCLLAFGFPIYLWRKASRQEPHSLALVAV